MNYTLTRNIKKLAVGQVVYSAMCYENGMMFDDGTLLRLSETGFRWICGDEYAGEWLKEIAKKKNFKVNVKNSTDQISNVSIQGPKSREILKKLIFTPPTQPSIDELEWFRFTICRIENLQGIPLLFQEQDILVSLVMKYGAIQKTPLIFGINLWKLEKMKV